MRVNLLVMLLKVRGCCVLLGRVSTKVSGRGI